MGFAVPVAMRLVSEFMTRRPQTIGCEQRLDVALAMMRALDIRHLPVLDEGKLVGLLTDGDVPGGPDAALTARVSERMSRGPYTVTPGASLSDVADMFAHCKFDAAVVLAPDGMVLGVFTTVDLARALLETLRTQSSPPSIRSDQWGHSIG